MNKRMTKTKEKRAKKLKIIFIGTPDFGAIMLEKLIDNGYLPSLVITNPDRPSGRGKKINESAVSKISKKYKIDLIKPEKIKTAGDKIEKIEPDLIIVAAYGQYIPLWIIGIPKYGTINVHPSLLPKYRGSSPIQYPIFNGDKETGTTIMLMNEEMDKGDILSQKKIILNSNETYESLFVKLSNLSANLLIKTIPSWINGKIKPKKQNKAKAVYSKVLNRYDGKIDWKNSANYIERQVRAFNPWPGSYTYFKLPNLKNEKLFKVLDGGILKQTKVGPFGPPGKTYVAPNGNIAVQTGKDFFIIKKFQIEGGVAINSSDYLKDNISLIGLILK
ncbi:MAG: methionyl-tRNA formyltransferase [Candidatus Pacebacteria bacterium]|nr:methionyl-tRNA formyltransferase [Candidatus Paceibacterota bacterium]